ncbi:YdiU family protein [Poseidonibacter lekithochrous]|uniref:protein adenylyltransferase SelO n=1 Tax=Poseidonibacter TaxID=2321187 RepID=UPI001C0977FE|nr:MULTISPECIES: protein adenylyltransferase SelO family protein [Poseidonibacter]MBU3015012.1 YdiU family protein [Poseidonibacter lekithochrous]MDO6828309.1 protein adenylyltransferase SelO family protein [Poseidonibacter sp. 1_MG-2023]
MNEIKQNQKPIKSLEDLAKFADYSLMKTLNEDPQSKADGTDHNPRQVFSGHYVPVNPTPIKNPEYIAHSKSLFAELGFDDSLAQSADFIKMFSGDISQVPKPMSKVGWACGYALSIYGNEYYQQCPFQTGNGYGDGRAVSVLEAVINDKRWEMQLKGGGRTPYCRGADGRAVLRSSVREFLAQEHMYSLGVPTSRSLSLYTSKSETVDRPWFSQGSYSKDPDMMISENIAITTRVAPSFIRVGQVELFARRARKNEHPKAMQELEQIVLHLIEREYSNEIDVIDKNLSLEDKVVLLAIKFRKRLTKLIANWIRVGYCQGNFNSDNCAAGGFTLDYGPFGFIEAFDPYYQPWSSSGDHFSFLNQPLAAEQNFHVFYSALRVLIGSSKKHIEELDKIRDDFSKVMQEEMNIMWASKLGLDTFDEELFNELVILMVKSSVDYTIFFRELSSIPTEIKALKKSFYGSNYDESIEQSWIKWLEKWNSLISNNTNELSSQMKLINPKYTLREWFLVPAYKQANEGDYALIKELQEIMTNPYSEQSIEVENKYYSLKPLEFFELGGVSHVSCSS